MSGKFILEQQAGQLHGEIKTQDVTISGTWPTALPLVPLAKRKDFFLQNLTGVDIWVGGSDVTQFSGIKVTAAGTWGAQLGRSTIYAVTASTTVSGVRVMEIV